MIKAACLSTDRVNRFWLYRRWDEAKSLALVVGLNPSTADADSDDATVRKLYGFFKLWGYGGYYLVNLFPFRATNPEDLRKVGDVIMASQEENFAAFSYCALEVKKSNYSHGKPVEKAECLTLCAWGTNGGIHSHDILVLEWLRKLGASPYALRVTKDGFPSHPLYIPYKQGLYPYELR